MDPFDPYAIFPLGYFAQSNSDPQIFNFKFINNYIFNTSPPLARRLDFRHVLRIRRTFTSLYSHAFQRHKAVWLRFSNYRQYLFYLSVLYTNANIHPSIGLEISARFRQTPYQIKKKILHHFINRTITRGKNDHKKVNAEQWSVLLCIMP